MKSLNSNQDKTETINKFKKPNPNTENQARKGAWIPAFAGMEKIPGKYYQCQILPIFQ
jgi:hypothetical protein